MKRKLLALSAFAVLSLSFIQHGTFAAANGTDRPVTGTEHTVYTLQDNQNASELKNDFFLPQATITAAEGIQLIVNALDVNLDSVRFVKPPLASDYFAKASNNAWYASALIIAANQGFDLPADLDPNKMWTKEEFVHQLMTVMQSQNKLPMLKIVPVTIGDERELKADYQGSVQRALVLGFTALDEKGNFHPKAEISRQESAVILQHALDYIKAHPGLPTQQAAGK